MAKVSIVIPVYNEVRTIEKVLDKIRNIDLGPHDREVVIVDGASTDGTRELLRQIADPWVLVVYEVFRRGKGTAVAEGIRQATGDCVIIQDADSEYNPDDIPQLVLPILEGRAQVVYGSRFRGQPENMTLPRRLANWTITFVINRLYGSKLTDACTCYKALSGDLVRGLKLETASFDVCLEITGKVRRRGIPIHEIPITYRARGGGDDVKSDWTAFPKALATAIKYRFKDLDSEGDELLASPKELLE